MNTASKLRIVAEAITDGTEPDWDAAESHATDDRARALIGHLRAVSHIGRERATLYSTGLSAAIGEVPLDLKPGATWGPLQIREKVGRGRFGDVYRAWEPNLDRDVALKILRRLEPTDPLASAIVHEGRLMARIRHPNVVTIHGAHRIDGRTGLWMEFIHGQTLEAELADRGPFEAGELTRIGTEVCAALEAVHAAGLVHRDVKAQNVMRERSGRIVLGDFGTGLELEAAASCPPDMAGTPAYLAPEVFERQAATPRSDIYSVGALLFHLATRDYPVKGSSFSALRDAHRNRQRATLRASRPDLPAGLASAIDRALDPDPSQRPARASEFAAALEAASRPRPTRLYAAAVLALAGLGVTALVALLMGAPDGSPVTSVDRHTVLVTAATNRTGESVLDGTLEYALQREISQSPFVIVVPRPRVADTLRLMRKPMDSPLDALTSREVALRDGDIDALVTGRVEKAGDAYGVSIDLIEPSSGTMLASIVEQPVPQGELLKAIGRAAIAVRRRLGEGLESLEASRLELAQVTTPSLKALQLFSQAAAMLDGQGGALAGAAAGEQLLRAAIAEDPSFAAAHVWLSEMIRAQPVNRLPEVLDHIKQAIALSDGVTEVERLGIEGALAVQGEMTSDPVERRRWIEHGIAKNEAILRLQPNNYSSLVILTNLYQQLGQPHVAYAARLSDLRPRAWEWATRASFAALWHGDVEAARRYAYRGGAAQIPVAPVGEAVGAPSWLRLFDAWEAWLRNDVHAAAAVADRVGATFGALRGYEQSEFALGLTRINLALGRLTLASTFAARIADPGHRRNLQVLVARQREDPRRLRELLLREFPDLEQAPSSWLVDAGELDAAKRSFARSSRPPAVTLDFAGGMIAMAEHRIEDAVSAFDRSLATYLDLDGHHVAVKLASALAERGDVERAITLLERFSAQRVPALRWNRWQAVNWLMVREQLASRYRQVGRHDDAAKVAEELRLLMAVADADHPVRVRLDIK